ncbi:MAG TPA: ATP-binding protein [Myxococcota bacterium]|jgi:signal transduction histidine kinase
MHDEDSGAEGLGPIAILVILVLGACLSVLVWRSLSSHWELEVERQTESYASSLSDMLEVEFARLDGMLRRRAQIWVTPRFASDPESWRDSVDTLLAENPAILAVLRMDGRAELAGSEEAKQTLRDVLDEARRQEVDTDAEFFVGPVIAADGRAVFGVQVRAASGGNDKRTVFALVDAHRVVKDIVDKSAHGFALAVSAGGREIYRRDSPNGRVRHSIRKTERVQLPIGAPWLLEVTPASDTELASWEQGPAIALAGGLLASGLISAAVHFGTISWRRERMLRQVNAALQTQIADTQRGERELRKLSEGLEARVSERTGELNETIVELETFNYSVSHDLRGPLGAVINFAAILQEDYGDRLDAMGKDHLQRIIGSASSAVSMMDALLAFSRSGRTELRKTHLDMSRVVQEVCDELAASHPHLKSAVKVGDLPNAFADESMIRFIFTNLISNALKFARKDDVPEVEVGGNPGSNETVYFVRDNGVGFDMRFAEKLFRVFERLHASDGYEGHGVGLAIVARMVRRHGGRYWAQGAVGKGATFYFTVATTGGEDGRPAN